MLVQNGAVSVAGRMPKLMRIYRDIRERAKYA